VAELDRLEAARHDPATRRAETTAEARLVAERQLTEARRSLESSTAGRRERVRLEAVHEHAAGRVDALRAEERTIRETAPELPDAKRVAATERILGDRRRLRVEAAIALEPAYLSDALGSRPEGIRARLEWERAIDHVERHRQRLGVRDPERALGAEPRGRAEQARWQAAWRELDTMRARVADRELTRPRERVTGLEIER
jgi:hypothetical protein